MFDVIARTLGDSPLQPAREPAADANAERIDWSAALATVGGDRELLRDVVDAFLQEGPRLLGELRKAAVDSDAEGLRRAVHTLKASLRYLGAETLFDRAVELEAIGREGRLADVAAALVRFDKPLELLLAGLSRKADTETGKSE